VRGTWCVADAPAPSQRDLVTQIAAALGRATPRALPTFVAQAAARTMDAFDAARRSESREWAYTVDTLTTETQVDGSAIDDLLGYKQRFSIGDGIDRTVAWLRET